MLKAQRRHRPPCKRSEWDPGYAKCVCPIVIRGTLTGKPLTVSTAKFLPPDKARDLEAARNLAIPDGVIAMEGNGPLHGTHRHLGKIVLADDPVAADFTCARLMGLDPNRVWHLNRAAHFLGNGSNHRINLIGEALPPRAIPFNVLPEFAYLQTCV